MPITFEQRRRRTGLIFVGPALFVLAMILGFPVVDSIMLALQRVQLTGGSVEQSWVGLANFQRLFNDEVFWKAALNTSYFSVMEVILVTLISLGVALLLNHPM